MRHDQNIVLHVVAVLLIGLTFLSVNSVAIGDPPSTTTLSKYVADPYVHAVAEAIQEASSPAIKGQFTSNELKYLSSVRFVSSPAIVDYSYQDCIVSVDECKVLRTATTFGGVQSSPKPLVLDSNEFWSRIAVLAEYRKQVGAFPPSNLVNEDILRSGLDHHERMNVDAVTIHSRLTMNLEGIIPLAGGIYCTLIGFGVVAPGKNVEKNEQWRPKFGTFMKIVGPLLIAFGLVELFGLLG